MSIERDEYDLWAESSEEATRKEQNLNYLTMLGNIVRWVNDACDFIDQEMQTMEVQDE